MKTDEESDKYSISDFRFRPGLARLARDTMLSL